MLALAVNFVIFRRLFRASLPAQYSEDELPAPKEVVPDERFFRASIAVFSVVVVGYAIGDLVHVPAYAFAIAGAAVLLGIGLCLRRVKIGILREVSWSVFPFVVGLFFVVGALENLGLSVFVTRALSAGAHSKILAVVVGVFGAGVGSNLVNNIPMALLATSSVKHGDDLTRYATLLGCNLGPNLTVTGSLATMLVIATARKQGEKIGAKDFFKVGLITTPALLAAGALGLLATGVFFR
jgi:arsenical pump membrane protein